MAGLRGQALLRLVLEGERGRWRVLRVETALSGFGRLREVQVAPMGPFTSPPPTGTGGARCAPGTTGCYASFRGRAVAGLLRKRTSKTPFRRVAWAVPSSMGPGRSRVRRKVPMGLSSKR